MQLEMYSDKEEIYFCYLCDYRCKLLKRVFGHIDYYFENSHNHEEYISNIEMPDIKS
jgi:hypothetical protein